MYLEFHWNSFENFSNCFLDYFEIARKVHMQISPRVDLEFSSVIASKIPTVSSSEISPRISIGISLEVLSDIFFRIWNYSYLQYFFVNSSGIFFKNFLELLRNIPSRVLSDISQGILYELPATILTKFKRFYRKVFHKLLWSLLAVFFFKAYFRNSVWAFSGHYFWNYTGHFFRKPNWLNEFLLNSLWELLHDLCWKFFREFSRQFL